MSSLVVGPARCPLCGGTARLSVAKSQLGVLTMNCCNAQLFARSDRSDALLRGLVLPPEAPVPAPAPAPAADATEPAGTPVRTEPAAPSAARKGFGLLGGWA